MWETIHILCFHFIQAFKIIFNFGSKLNFKLNILCLFSCRKRLQVGTHSNNRKILLEVCTRSRRRQIEHGLVYSIINLFIIFQALTKFIKINVCFGEERQNPLYRSNTDHKILISTNHTHDPWTKELNIGHDMIKKSLLVLDQKLSPTSISWSNPFRNLIRMGTVDNYYRSVLAYW